MEIYYLFWMCSRDQNQKRKHVAIHFFSHFTVIKVTTMKTTIYRPLYLCVCEREHSARSTFNFRPNWGYNWWPNQVWKEASFTKISTSHMDDKGYFRNNRSSKSYITSTGIHWIFPKMTYPIIITGQFTCVLIHLMHNNIKCTWLTHYNKFVVTGAKSHWLLKCVEVSGPLTVSL